MSMIAGNLNPDRGRITVTGAISWPIGLTGTIQGDLTGIQNVRFLGRIYGVDTDELVDFVGSFADLGPNYAEPVRTYSSGMRGRLAFGMAMGIRFDTYLIDEVTAAGDAAFAARDWARAEASYAAALAAAAQDASYTAVAVLYSNR